MAEQGAVDAQNVATAIEVNGQEQHHQHIAQNRRHSRRQNAQLWHAKPALNQGGGHNQTDATGQAQSQEWGLAVTDAAQYWGVDDVDKQDGAARQHGLYIRQCQWNQARICAQAF